MVFNKWSNTLEEVKQFIHTHGNIPQYNINNLEEHNLYLWINFQLKMKTTNNIIDCDIRTEWENFVNNDKYKEYFVSHIDKWCNKLEKVKSFMDTNKRLPMKDGQTLDERKLFIWLRIQTTNYENNKFNMKNNIIRTNWEIFIESDIYITYQASNKSTIYNVVSNITQYIAQYLPI
jgi:hypothetical protein